MKAILTDDHTGREIFWHEGRFWTRLPGSDDVHEIDTFTARRHEDGTVTLVVAFAPEPEPRPKLALVS